MNLHNLQLYHILTFIILKYLNFLIKFNIFIIIDNIYYNKIKSIKSIKFILDS